MNLILGPNKSLKKVSDIVEEDEFGEEMEAFCTLMLRVMRNLGGVGLSAVQIGFHKRILVGDANGEEIVMINPVIKELSSDEVDMEEGCLSFPLNIFKVKRPESLVVEFRDASGASREESFEGLAARIIQHEIDHLNGVTILDTVSRLKRNIYTRKINKFLKKERRKRGL